MVAGGEVAKCWGDVVDDVEHDGAGRLEPCVAADGAASMTVSRRSKALAHGVFQGGRSLEFYVDAERVAEAGREDRDLLRLCHVSAPGEEREELLLVVVHRARALDVDELAQRVAACRRAEAEVDELDEARLGRHTLVALQMVIPLLGDALQVVGGELDLVVVGGLGLTEELLATMNPCDRVRRSI